MQWFHVSYKRTSVPACTNLCQKTLWPNRVYMSHKLPKLQQVHTAQISIHLRVCVCTKGVEYYANFKRRDLYRRQQHPCEQQSPCNAEEVRIHKQPIITSPKLAKPNRLRNQSGRLLACIPLGRNPCPGSILALGAPYDIHILMPLHRGLSSEWLFPMCLRGCAAQKLKT